MLIALPLFGITVIHFGTDPHPIASLFHRIADQDTGLLGLLVTLGALVVTGYVIFGTWATVTIIIFLALSRFDQDTAKHMPMPVSDGAEWESNLTGSQVYSLITKVMILTVISGAIGALALSVLL